MLGREVVERHSSVPIPCSGVGRLLVLGRRTPGSAGGLDFGHPRSSCKRTFGLRVALRSNIGDSTFAVLCPASAVARFRPDLTGGPSRTRARHRMAKPRRHVDPAQLQVEQAG